VAQKQTEAVTIQFDKNLKANGEALFHSLGLSFSSAMNTLLREAVQKGKVPISGIQLESSDDSDAQAADAYAYSPEKAERWAVEDPQFCKENYESDTFFDKMNQAKLRLSIESGKYIERKRTTEAAAMMGDDAAAIDDPEFDAELFARDPVFDRATQAEIRRRAAESEANPSDLVDWEELKALAAADV
jgi:addiction module RelB/DinJ family antitoxin